MILNFKFSYCVENTKNYRKLFFKNYLQNRVYKYRKIYNKQESIRHEIIIIKKGLKIDRLLT